MLVPNKYMNFKTSIINIAATILELLQNRESEEYNTIINKVIDNHGYDAKYQFVNSINFLFLLGKIKYNIETDSLELIQ